MAAIQALVSLTEGVGGSMLIPSPPLTHEVWGCRCVFVPAPQQNLPLQEKGSFPRSLICRRENVTAGVWVFLHSPLPEMLGDGARRRWSPSFHQPVSSCSPRYRYHQLGILVWLDFHVLLSITGYLPMAVAAYERSDLP